MHTLTALDKTIVSASISTERLVGRFYDSRDIRVIVSIGSLSDVVLEKPVAFYADVRLSHSLDDGGYDMDNIYSMSDIDWQYDDDADRVRYTYADGTSVLVHDDLPREVEKMISDFMWGAQCKATDAYEDAMRKSLGL
jgi:hypothetical protein